MAVTNTLKLNISMGAVNNMSPTMGAIQNSLDRLRTQWLQTAAVMRGFNLVTDLFRDAGRATIEVVEDSITAFAEFEDQLLFTEKVLGDRMTISMETLQKQVVALSASVPIASQNLAELSTIGAQMGLAANELNQFMETSAKLMTTSGLKAEVTALLFGRLKAALGVTTDEFENIGSALVGVANISADSTKNIAEATLRAAGSARQLGLAAQDVAAFAASATELGFRPMRAGSALSKLFKLLQTDIAKFSQAANVNLPQMKEALRIAGLGKDAPGGLRVAQREAANLFLVWLKGMKDSSRTAAEQTEVIGKLVGGHQVLQNIVASLITNVDEVAKKWRASNKAFNEGTLLSKAMERQMSSLKSEITLLDNALEAFNIKLGKALKPILVPFIKLLRDMLRVVSELPAPVLRTATAIGILSSALALLITPLVVLHLSFGSLGASVLILKLAFTSVINVMSKWLAMAGLTILRAGMMALTLGGVTTSVETLRVAFGRLLFPFGTAAAVSFSKFLAIIGVTLPVIIAMAAAITTLVFALLNWEAIWKNVTNAISKSEVIGVLQLSIEKLGIAWNKLVKAFTTPLMKAFGKDMAFNVDMVQLFSDALVMAIELLTSIIVVVTEVATVVVTTLTPAFAAVGEMIRSVINMFLGVGDILRGVFTLDHTLIISGFKRLLGSIINFFVQPLLAIFRTMSNFIGGVFGLIRGSDDAFTRAANTVSGTIANAANVTGQTLLPNKIPGGVPTTGSPKALARGGIVSGPLGNIGGDVFRVGEAGAEAVIPLGPLQRTISGSRQVSKDIVDELRNLSQMIAQNQDVGGEITIPITINLDGQQISQSVKKIDFSEILENGGSLPFSFGGVG